MYFFRFIGQRHQKACRRKAETSTELQIHNDVNAILSSSKRDQCLSKRNESGSMYQESKNLADESISSSVHLNSNVEGLLPTVITFGTVSCAVKVRNLLLYHPNMYLPIKIKGINFWSF